MQCDYKYADLLDDDVFKLVFGQESTKDVMIEFLNQLIDDKTIVDVEFVDKEMRPLYRDQKTSVYDLFCRTDDGSRIIVELQKRKQESYAERMLYYSMHQVLRQVEIGKDSFDFCPIYVISIMDFTLDQNEGMSNVKSVFRLYEESTHSCLTGRLTYIFLELPKLNKRADELNGDVLEGMCFCLKNMSSLQDRPQALTHSVFDKIFGVCEFVEMSEELRDKILEKMTTERDLKNQFAYARKEGRAVGLEEGRAEGRLEGRLEGRVEIARRMLAAGMDVKQVADLAMLTLSEVEAL